MKTWAGLSRTLVLFLLTGLARPLFAGEKSANLTRADSGKARAVVEAFRLAWLANDPEAVMRLFTKDAVLLPHHGLAPVVGDPAIRRFWWPADSPPTTVTEFSQPIDEVGGSGNLAYVRGRSTVSWVSGKGPEAKSFSNAGTQLMLLRRQPDGSWLISHLMWDDPPNQLR